jgi:hypothetical protein
MNIKLANIKLNELKVVLNESTDLSMTKLFSKTRFKGWNVIAYKKKQVFFEHPNGYVFRVEVDNIDGDTMYSVYAKWPNKAKASINDPNFGIKDLGKKGQSFSEMFTRDELEKKLPVLNKVIKKMTNGKK